MALDTYNALKASALAWVERTGDEAAETLVSDCVTLCEARVNKVPNFRLPEMETTLTLPVSDGQATLPLNFLALHRVTANASSPHLLTYAEPSWYQAVFPQSGLDEGCGFYTIYGTSAVFTGIDGTETLPTGSNVQILHTRAASTISIVYYAKVPALATTNSNWLLLKSPDVYLYGTILELLNALEGVGVEKYAGMFGAAVEGLIQSATFSRGGVLTMRASMPAP